MSEPKETMAVDYPADVRLSLGETKEEFAQELKMLAAVKLYEMGKVSSGRAAAPAGTDRVSFLLGLDRHRVSVFNYTPEELEREVREASARAA